MPSHRAVTMEELTGFLHLPEKISARCGVLTCKNEQLKSLDKKLGKTENGSDREDLSAKAEEIKKEKIAVALTYGTSSSVPANLLVPAGGVSESIWSCAAVEPASAHAIPSGRVSEHATPRVRPIPTPTADLAGKPEGPASSTHSPVPSDGRPVRTRRATPAAAALLECARAAKDKQNNRAKGLKEEKDDPKQNRRCGDDDPKGKDGKGSRKGNTKTPTKEAQKQSKGIAGGGGRAAGSGRRKAAIPTPPDEDHELSEHDSGDVFAESIPDELDHHSSAGLEDHSHFTDLHSATRPHWGAHDNSLEADSPHTPPSQDSAKLLCHSIINNSMGLNVSIAKAGAAGIVPAAFGSDLEIASALAAAVTSPRNRTQVAVAAAVAAPGLHHAGVQLQRKPLVHIAHVNAAAAKAPPALPTIAHAVAAAGGAAGAAAAGGEAEEAHAHFGADLMHDAGGERDLISFFCHHEHAGDSEDTVLLDARHEESPHSSVESAASTRMDDQAPMISPMTKETADWTSGESFLLAPTTPEVKKAGDAFPLPIPRTTSSEVATA